MTAARLAAIAGTLGREPAEVAWIDDGYDFEVALADGWAFRFPRREGVVEALEAEIAFLPALASALPVAVPRFEHVVRTPERFVAYRAIEGTPLRDEDPRGIAAFLSALHAFDVGELPVPRPDTRAAFEEQCGRFRSAVMPLLDADERARGERLFAETAVLEGFTPALLHGDLGPAHLLCRDGVLVGVIDWGDARVGDPALDLSWLLHAHPQGEEILASYDGPVDDGFRRRAAFYHRLAPWFEAHYGIFVGRPERVEIGLAGVRARLP